MAVSAKTRARIKKLIALATSPEPEEAARAREESERLMSYHGLTLADFEDDVIEPVENLRDDFPPPVSMAVARIRERLAIAVGVAYRCTPVSNRRVQVAFRGRPAVARAARDLFQTLVADVVAHCEIGRYEPGRDAWRLCYWMGFVDAVVERLMALEVQVREPAPRSSAPATQVAFPAELQEALDVATENLASTFHPLEAAEGVDAVRNDAYCSGHLRGRAAKIERPDQSPNRALAEKRA